ncbi:outer membrane protein assembly factor BamE [Rhodobacteraceae bacterium NNCM2]|nr:outer membrane protein assembly factor BamE [Coraliihabitans acroporae]
MRTMAKVSVSAIALLGVAACTPEVRNHGFAPDPELVETIQAGSDTRGSVRRKVGRPSYSGVFDPNGWFYIATTVEHLTYHAPKVIDRRIVAISFDDRDIVTSVKTYGLEDGKIIDLETRTTPTAGRELTILEQVLGNIGFDATSIVGDN